MTVSAADLRTLVGTTKSDPELAMFCTHGQLVVDTLLANSGLGSTILDVIALNLAGHFFVISVEAGGVTYKRAGQSEERYKTFGYDAHGFMTTRFGQMACALDSSGTLIVASNKNKVKFDVESYSTYNSRDLPARDEI